MTGYVRIAPLIVAAAAIAVAVPATVLAEPTTPTTTTTTTTTAPLTTTEAQTTTTQAPLTTTTQPQTTTTQAKTTTAQTTPTTTTTQSSKALGSNVVLEITGSGTVYSIDIDPGGRVATENSAVPFRTSIAAEPGTLVQIIAVTKTGSQGCRITVDGTVVVSQGAGNAHCIFTIP